MAPAVVAMVLSLLKTSLKQTTQLATLVSSMLGDELINPAIKLLSEIKSDIEIGNILKFAFRTCQFKLIFPHSPTITAT